jgi:iron complex outermembrane receptor protein
MDLSLAYGLNNAFSVNGKASLVRAFNLKADDYLILTPPDRFDANLRFEPNKARNTFLQVGGLYVRQQDRVPANPAYNPAPGEENPVTFVPVNGDYSAPPAGYFLLQASLGTTFRVGKQPLEVSLTGNNLTNTTYRDYLNRFRYYADEMGRNIVLRVRLPLNFNS